MQRIRFALATVILAIAVTPARATELASHTIIIPIAGRVPGALGTNWRTDLFVTNAGATSTAEVTIVFSQEGRADKITTATLPPRVTFVYRDLIGDTFGLDNAIGMLRIVANSTDSKITARARIYNTGSGGGQYSQTVQGVPLAKLSSKVVIPGLTSVDGYRTNIGIANPGPQQAFAFVTLYDSSGESHGGFSVSVQPHSVLTMNNLIEPFGAYEGVTVSVNANVPVYAYGSVIRSDTGDSDFVSGVGVVPAAGDVVITPACANPAPLHLAAIPAGGWTVLFQPGVDPFTRTPALASKYAFTPATIYQFGGFFADLTPAQIAELRCEPDVRVIEQNAAVPLP